MTAAAPNLLRRLKHRHLELLLAIARHGSLTRVAAQAGVSQPAATKALLEIEDIFGAPLFLRTGRGLQPTPLGELAISRARRMLNDLALWSREAQALQGGHAAHLHVGAVPYVSSVLLSSAIAQLHARHGITVTLHRATTDHLLPMLRRHELDCMIGRVSALIELDGLTHETLYHQRPSLIAHRQLARRLSARAPDWAGAAALRWVLPEAKTPTRQLIAEHFIRHGVIPPHPIVEAYSTDVIEGLLGGDPSLVSVVPQEIAHELAARGRIGAVHWDWGWNLPPINLIRRVRDEVRGPGPEEALAAILDELKGQIPLATA
ncbi:LysR family transcriptional regulator [Bordetella genomosp. 1]|uniref:LysR family transcriptional regulator n=1 Tax=Bordetella genomosp. 1 TaxID=1395607 RepID=A0A261RVT7_9BORD|nr:LysR family transcriptional regulator [Bordetella genomosp. 1]MDQ8035107.1 LysR family transcriptional regulator [Bordetella sp.]OZI29001.1 LysR family transcriptional regulator [Bordetella genomosp. 1]OZI68101.1 LysR family transcriptional regulator [Bordetella genomosp. 1]